MVRWKFPGIIASVAVAVILSQSSCGFQKSPSDIAQDITVLINQCSVGSGVIFKHEKNSYSVLTAGHVLSKKVDCLVITSDKEIYTAKKNNFIYYPGLDLAVIQFESEKSYPVGKLGKSEAATIGKTVYVAGAPDINKTIPERAIRVSQGKIISTPPEGELGYTLVYDNSTKKGMSGGPVLDEKGEVIGIHGRGESADGSKESYGIPIQRFLEYKSADVVAEGRRAESKKSQEVNKNYIIIVDYIILYALISIYPFAILMLKQEDGWEDGWFETKIVILSVSILILTWVLLPFYYNLWGIARYELGDKKGTIADYNKAIEINPNYATAYYNRGNARDDLGDKESAIADYTKAIEINPNNAKAYNNRGFARYELGDKKSAIADYTKAIEINPNYAYAYFNRGNARSDLGDKKSAIEDFEKAAELYNQQGKQSDVQDSLNRLKKLRR